MGASAVLGTRRPVLGRSSEKVPAVGYMSSTSCCGLHPIFRHNVNDWVFLSNHGWALLCVARDPDMRLRDIADAIGITERAAHRLVNDLVEAGYIKRERRGNRNHYEVRPDMPMRHPLVQQHRIGEILAALADRPPQSESVRSNGRPEQRRGERRKLSTRRGTRTSDEGNGRTSGE